MIRKMQLKATDHLSNTKLQSLITDALELVDAPDELWSTCLRRNAKSSLVIRIVRLGESAPSTPAAPRLLILAWDPDLIRGPSPDFLADTFGLALTARQKVCLSWIARGKSSWEIGQILNISENTVNFHIKNVLKKLNSNSRTHAIIKAIQLGIIEHPSTERTEN